MLVVFAAVGLARFAFGMVLPSMAAELELGYARQGMLGASYFVGYLACVAVMPWIAPRVSLFANSAAAALPYSLLGFLQCPSPSGFWPLAVAYCVVGSGSGAAFIGAMSLPVAMVSPVASWARSRRRYCWCRPGHSVLRLSGPVRAQCLHSLPVAVGLGDLLRLRFRSIDDRDAAHP